MFPKLGAQSLIPSLRLLQLRPQRFGLRADDIDEARRQFGALGSRPSLQRGEILAFHFHQTRPESSDEIGRSHSGHTIT